MRTDFTIAPSNININQHQRLHCTALHCTPTDIYICACCDRPRNPNCIGKTCRHAPDNAEKFATTDSTPHDFLNQSRLVVHACNLGCVLQCHLLQEPRSLGNHLPVLPVSAAHFRNDGAQMVSKPNTNNSASASPSGKPMPWSIQNATN